MMEECAVLIPCFNEELTIGKVVRDFHACLPNATIYVYDNNSADRTAEVAKCAGAVVRSARSQGKGNVVRKMFQEIEARCYVMVDGDDTYPAADAPQMVEKVLRDGFDMVVGDRLSSTYFQENKRHFHNFGNDFVRQAVNLLFHADIKDIMTGYRAFSYDFVKTYPVVYEGFEIETDMTIHAVDKRLAIYNHIIQYKDRPMGSCSKLNTYSDGFKVLLTIFNLFRLYKPFIFFSILAGLLALVSAVFFVPVLRTYITYGVVPHFPTLIVCGFTATAALISFFAGLMLHSIAQSNRQNFENLRKLTRSITDYRP